MDYITTIAAYDGEKVYTSVKGENLFDFPRFLDQYFGLVTFYGDEFDIPMIEREFGIVVE